MRKWPIAVSVAITIVGVAPWLLSWSSLPAQVATHWDVHGDANGHLSKGAALAVFGGIAAVLAIGAALRSHDMASPVLVFVGALLACASLSTVLANKDVVTWQDAEMSLLWIAVGIIAGVGAALVYAPHVKAHTPPHTSTPPPVLEVGPSERLAWTGTGRGPSFYAISVFLLVGAVLLFISAPPGGIVMLFVAIVVAQFGAVRVVIGSRGVRMSGPFGIPYMTIPLDRIISAEALEVRPMSWGGWGYRGSLRFMHRAAWIVRTGPGIRLDLRDDKTFVVTVDGAEEAAAVVNGLLTSTPR